MTRPYVAVPSALVPTLDAWADAWSLAKTGILGAMLEAWRETRNVDRAVLESAAAVDHGPVAKQYARLAPATGETFSAECAFTGLPVPSFVAALAARWAQLAAEDQERYAVPWAADAVARGTITWALLSRLAEGPATSAEIQRAIGHEGAEVAGVWVSFLRARGLAERVERNLWAITERGKIVAKYPKTEAFSRKAKGAKK